jgi:tetratricopeptide (TPR) repeat protein
VAEFVTPAQYVLGDSFARFYQGVNAAPVPTGMSELEAEQYQITIEEQTQPLKDKAIEWHKANAALATLTDGALWDQWIAKSFEALAGLSAGYYQRELHRPAIPTTDSALLAGFAQLDAGQLDAALVSADALISSRSIVTPPPTPVQTVSTKKSKNRKTVPIVAAPIIAPDPSPLAQARLLRALSLMKLGRFNDADATLTQASADMPDWAELPYTQGINRELYLKQAQGALDAYTRYLALSGTDKTVQKWVNLLQKQLSLPLTSFAKPTPVVAPATTDTPTAEPTAPAISEAAPPIIPAASTPDATRTETPQ